MIQSYNKPPYLLNVRKAISEMVIFWEFIGSNMGLAGFRKRVKMWDDGKPNGGMWNKNTVVGTRFAHFDRWDAG